MGHPGEEECVRVGEDGWPWVGCFHEVSDLIRWSRGVRGRNVHGVHVAWKVSRGKKGEMRLRYWLRSRWEESSLLSQGEWT